MPVDHEFSIPFRYNACDECDDLHFPTDGVCPACGAEYELTIDKHVEFRREVTAPLRESMSAPLPPGTPSAYIALEKELDAIYKSLPGIVQAIFDEEPDGGRRFRQQIERMRRVKANAAVTNTNQETFPSWPAFVADIHVMEQVVEAHLDLLNAETPDESRMMSTRLEEATGRFSHAEGTAPGLPTSLMTPQQAEQAAAIWLRSNGYDAYITGAGADGGIDVEAPGVVAQVKRWSKPVGRPEVQKLHGVATQRDAIAIFFTTEGYTKQAIEFADSVGMALLVLNSSTSAEPANQVGKFIGAPTQTPQRDSGTPSAIQRTGGCLLPVLVIIFGASLLSLRITTQRQTRKDRQPPVG